MWSRNLPASASPRNLLECKIVCHLIISHLPPIPTIHPRLWAGGRSRNQSCTSSTAPPGSSEVLAWQTWKHNILIGIFLGKYLMGETEDFTLICRWAQAKKIDSKLRLVLIPQSCFNFQSILSTILYKICSGTNLRFSSWSGGPKRARFTRDVSGSAGAARGRFPLSPPFPPPPPPSPLEPDGFLRKFCNKILMNTLSALENTLRGEKLLIRWCKVTRKSL